MRAKSYFITIAKKNSQRGVTQRAPIILFTLPRVAPLHRCHFATLPLCHEFFLFLPLYGFATVRFCHCTVSPLYGSATVRFDQLPRSYAAYRLSRIARTKRVTRRRPKTPSRPRALGFEGGRRTRPPIGTKSAACRPRSTAHLALVVSVPKSTIVRKGGALVVHDSALTRHQFCCASLALRP